MFACWLTYVYFNVFANNVNKKMNKNNSPQRTLRTQALLGIVGLSLVLMTHVTLLFDYEFLQSGRPVIAQ